MRLILIFLILNLFLIKDSCGQNFDINTVRKINSNSSNFKTNFFKADANSVFVINIAAPATIFITGLAKHDAKLKKDGAYMLGTFIFSSLFVQGAKRVFKKNRPFVDYADIVKRDAGGGYSFPSGHTAAAFTTATSLSILYPKWYVIVPCYAWATSVAYARMYQGVHYPSDVFAGAIVGAGSAWLGYKVQKWMDKKYHQKKTEPTF
jgi:membrane-associated phospholipid phosphatase